MIILNVDDDAEDQEFFAGAVKKIDSSIQCLTANDSFDAQSLLTNLATSSSLDYIFLDINMPKMNGLELLKIIKKDKRLSHIQVFMLSTTSSEREIASIKALGAKYLQKQGEFDKTVNILSSILMPQNEVVD